MNHKAATAQDRRAGSRRGRPTKPTPSVQRHICAAIEAGNFIEIAAELSGVGRSTVFRWLALADGGEPEYQDFRDAVNRARAMAEALAVSAIQKAGRRTWQANAWFLERSFPERWRRRDGTYDNERAHAAERVGQAVQVPDAAASLSDALRRDPNQIARTMAALEVLADVMDGQPASAGAPVVEIASSRLPLAPGDDPPTPR